MFLYKHSLTRFCVDIGSLILLGIYLRVDLQGHTITLDLTSERNIKLVSKVAMTFYIHTSSV